MNKKGVEYDEQNIYKILGAEWFQKVVFFLEKVKFQIIDILPINLCSLITKYYDKKCEKTLAKMHSSVMKERLKEKYLKDKMKIKKEFSQKENNNYHFNQNNYDETVDYLKANKNIHIEGLKSNLIWFLISLLFIILTRGALFGISLVIFIINIVGAFINFECINLQNYNLSRLKEKKEILLKLQQRRNKKYYENNEALIEGFTEEVSKTLDFPSTERLVEIAEEKEKIENLKQLVLNEMNNRQNKRKIKGGY